MTWTYNPADLSSSLAKVRLMIGDTNTNDQLLQDEEINYFLTVNSSPMSAAVMAARAIASKFARLADTDIETASVKYSQKAKGYADLADTLEKQSNSALSGGLAGPSATGISIAAMEQADDDTDRPIPENRKGMFDNPPNAEFRDGRIR